MNLMSEKKSAEEQKNKKTLYFGFNIHLTTQNYKAL